MNQKEYKVPVWQINGMEFPYDFDDLEAIERYEKAFKTMKVKADQMPKDGTRSSQIKLYCEAIFKLFDDLFGKGTADKLFQGKINSRICDEVYESFLNFVHTNVMATDQARMNRLQRYVGKPQDHRRSNKHHAKRYH